MEYSLELQRVMMEEAGKTVAPIMAMDALTRMVAAFRKFSAEYDDELIAKLLVRKEMMEEIGVLETIAIVQSELRTA